MATFSYPPLVYTQRPPTGEALWLPQSVCETLGVKRGDRLTVEQFESRAVQELLEARRRVQAAPTATQEGGLV